MTSLASPPRRHAKLSHMGVEISILAGAATASDHTLIEYVAPPMFPGPHLHWHLQSTEWFYILEGEISFEMDGKQLTAGPAEYIEVPSRTQHRWSNAQPRQLKMLVGFTLPSLDGYFEELFSYAKTLPEWPPTSPAYLIALAERYDTFTGPIH
jgi:mannose-6-phosphate isomerase-like protein (cupin superfamily)